MTPDTAGADRRPRSSWMSLAGLIALPVVALTGRRRPDDSRTNPSVQDHGADRTATAGEAASRALGRLPGP